MLKYTHFKYASTMKFYLKHYRKTIFKKYDSNHEDSKEKEKNIDYIYPFYNKVFEYLIHYRDHMSSYWKEPDF